MRSGAFILYTIGVRKSSLAVGTYPGVQYSCGDAIQPWGCNGDAVRAWRCNGGAIQPWGCNGDVVRPWGCNGDVGTGVGDAMGCSQAVGMYPGVQFSHGDVSRGGIQPWGCNGGYRDVYGAEIGLSYVAGTRRLCAVCNGAI